MASVRTAPHLKIRVQPRWDGGSSVFRVEHMHDAVHLGGLSQTAVGASHGVLHGVLHGAACVHAMSVATHLHVVAVPAVQGADQLGDLLPDLLVRRAVAHLTAARCSMATAMRERGGEESGGTRLEQRRVGLTEEVRGER